MQSKLAIKQANFRENTKTIAHGFLSNMEELGQKAIVDLNTPSCKN